MAESPEIDIGNLLANLPTALAEEQIDLLAGGSRMRIERIVSTGHHSPVDFWYDQPQREWVMLLQGTATLQFEDQSERLHLKPGDHVDIAAHRLHRVDATSTDEPTVWLAVFYET